MKSKKKVVLNANIQKYPKDFDELCQLVEIQNIQSINENVPGAVEIVEKNEFYQWVNNSDSEVRNVKEKMIKKGAIASTNLQPMTCGEFFHKYWLDLICAGAVTYFIHNTPELEKFSSAGNRYGNLKKQMELVHKQFSSILLINDDAQKLFYLSLDFLLKRGIRSPFLSGKGHGFLARDVMTKIVMYFIYSFIIPDFFIAHVKELEKISDLKAFHEWEYKQGFVLFQSKLYFVSEGAGLQFHELEQQNENTEQLKNQCSIIPEDKLVAFHKISSIDKAPELFDVCVAAAGRSLMKFSMTDNFVIDASNAIVHRFFDSKIETPSRLQSMAKEMKHAAIKQKKRDSILRYKTVSQLLSLDFPEIF